MVENASAPDEVKALTSQGWAAPHPGNETCIDNNTMSRSSPMRRVDPVKRWWRRVGPLVLGAALAGLTGGCNAPQIPLPPPVIDDLSFALSDAEGSHGTLSGSAENTPEMANSSVRVVNLRDQHGVITPAAADGSFETRPFEVRDGDDLQVDYTVDTELSEGLCVRVRHQGPLGPCLPPPAPGSP